MDNERAEKIKEVNEMFVNLCRQYSALGILLQPLASIANNPVYDDTRLKKVVNLLLTQYHEVGEQTKFMGELLEQLSQEPIIETDNFVTNPENN